MNRLANTTSPYLLQHANNPVDWYPWGDEALQQARSANKPIFLSIGYAACHWCHVMAHESFEDPATAELMNRHFVCIKVDREERPDLDSIYMSATSAMTGSGGWPMSVFLTPDLRPFYAGTYFPPVPRYNMPSFKELLSSLARAWQEEREEVDRVGSQVAGHLTARLPAAGSQGLTAADLDGAAEALLISYDWTHGGWGNAPKFPQPMAIEFLLRRAAANHPKANDYQRVAAHALEAMSRGGMYDVIGGGFARYSTDDHWQVPHFEKMLYDNAQLVLAYLHAWQLTGEPSFRRVVEETLEFVSREMTHPDGGFFSSLDADSEGAEGKFYVWTKDEIRSVIGEAQSFEFFEAAYGLTEKGNWEGVTVLQRALDNASLAARFKLDPLEVSAKLAESHTSLLKARASRVRPTTDDKVLTAWNALMLHTYAEAGRVLDKVDYLLVATRNADFLLAALHKDGRLHRSWRAGKVTEQVFLEDYAALILGLVELYQTDFDARWFASAQELAAEMIAGFRDPAGGFFDSLESKQGLLLRPKDLQDNATPSGNALACEALLKLAAFTNQGEYRDLAEGALRLITKPALDYPTAFARWLGAADFSLASVKQVAILYDPAGGDARNMLDVIRSAYRPNTIVAASSHPPSQGSPSLLLDRPLKGGLPTAYVCEHFVCKQPVTTPDELRIQL